METKKTLIIGGGEAGVRLGHLLEPDSGRSVTLVDTKDFFEIPSGTLRGFLEHETIGQRIRKAYRDFVNVDFVQGRIVELKSNEAVLDDGRVLDFDEAIVATGSNYANLPLVKPVLHKTIKEREAYFAEENARVETAESILVLGGGAVGVELAGEIKHKHPDKSVTLYEIAPALLSNFHPKAGVIAKRRLEELGVTILLNGQGVSERDYGLVYRSVGTRPNSDFMKWHFSDSLNDRGAIKVDAYFKVEGIENVYAIGDVTAIPELKQGANALSHAGKLARNLMNPTKAKAYRPAPPMALLTLGRKHGLAQLPFGVTTARLFVNFKQKDLLIDMLMKTVGAK